MLGCLETVNIMAGGVSWKIGIFISILLQLTLFLLLEVIGIP